MSAHHPTSRPDTRPITDAQWQAMLLKPTPVTTAVTNERRGESRARHHGIARVFLELSGKDGSHGRYLVRCRDISPTGIGFVHHQGAQAGTRCEVHLLTRGGRILRRRATVASCKPQKNGYFTIGLRLDGPIVLRGVAQDQSTQCA
ncbi:MAG: hypothetical protein GC164_01210 [Phycisphaera sp.]|nr:hypothetical protein [Phycisphaera sp.]